jgi:hypothetical protein
VRVDVAHDDHGDQPGDERPEPGFSQEEPDDLAHAVVRLSSFAVLEFRFDVGHLREVLDVDPPARRTVEAPYQIEQIVRADELRRQIWHGTSVQALDVRNLHAGSTQPAHREVLVLGELRHPPVRQLDDPPAVRPGQSHASDFIMSATDRPLRAPHSAMPFT